MSVTEQVTRVVLFGILLVVSVLYTLRAREFQQLSRYAPLFGGFLAIGLFTIITAREAVRLVRTKRKIKQDFSRTMEYMEEEPLQARTLSSATMYMGVVLLFFALIWLVGMKLAAPLFVGSFMLLDKETSARQAVWSVVGVVGFVLIFQRMGLSWSPGWLVTL